MIKLEFYAKESLFSYEKTHPYTLLKVYKPSRSQSHFDKNGTILFAIYSHKMSRAKIVVIKRI